MFALLLALACSGARPGCATPEEVLAEAGSETLRCADADPVLDWSRLLAGRPLPEPQAAELRASVKESFLADPARARRDLSALDGSARDLAGLPGLRAAELRGTALWNELHGEGRLPPRAAAALRRAAAPWEEDPKDQLVLTEVDIEGWIHYASLLSEIRGGGPLRVSIGQRVALYPIVRAAFRDGDRDTKIALLAMGAFWPAISDRWKSASYEGQQAFILVVPLPVEIPGNPEDWLRSVMAEPREHARVLHGTLGPFGLPR